MLINNKLFIYLSIYSHRHRDREGANLIGWALRLSGIVTRWNVRGSWLEPR